MRFSTLLFEENLIRMKGLKKIELQKPLGPVVALAGKNGSGKSRILNLIENYAENLIAEDIVFNTIEYYPEVGRTQVSDTLIQDLKKQYNLAPENRKAIVIRDINNDYVSNYGAILRSYIKKINSDILSKITNANVNTFEKFTEDTPFFDDIFNSLLTNSSLAYFQKISDELNLDKYNILTTEDEERDVLEQKESYIRFEKLKFYIEKFIGKKITTKAKKLTAGEAFSSVIQLNGKAFSAEQLSPGEKALLSYAILFFILDINSKNGLENCIIVIDEPENHLHPSALIKVISTIKDIIKDKGQLWIATHSLPLLASLETDEIFLVKNDTIIPPNRYNPGNSIIELMESEENFYRIKEFLFSSSDWAYSNFMTQCFLEPDVHLTASKGDTQISLFNDLVKSKETLSVLDYGAGKGRLASAIEEIDQLKNKIKYYCALEPNIEFLHLLKSNTFIQEIYQNDETLPSNYFDMVLLFNVLHEINPEEWLDIFNSIKKSLKDSGLLIIVEDKYLPKGEKINKYGYIILNEHQILDLFSIDHNEINEFNPLKSNNDNRITFSIIPKEKLNATQNTIITAIVNLKKEMFGKMEELRAKEFEVNYSKKDLSIGRKYAHYSQLYINTSIAETYLPLALSKKYGKPDLEETK